MKLLDKVKLLWSYFTDKPIEKGIGITTDDNITLPRDTGLDTLEGNVVHRGTFFSLKQINGSFELVGFAKSGDKVLYQLKHVYSGETFNVTLGMLNFLFEKQPL